MPLSGSGAPPVVIVFGLEDSSVRWLTRRMREYGAMAIHVRPDLPPAAAHSVVAAADAGIHVISAARGMDGTFLETWQLLAEAGKARYVAVHDLLPTALDVNEVAAIATRVLEEDVLPTTLPLLDDDESVIGVLDAVTGEQWFPDGHREAPRVDFSEAVALETNTLFDEAALAGLSPGMAIRAGQLCPAVSVDARSGSGVDWLVEHLPDRQTPAAGTVLPGDDADVVLIAAGQQQVAVGPAMVIVGSDTAEVTIRSLVDPLGPDLLASIAPGAVAAARIDPAPPIGALLLE